MDITPDNSNTQPISDDQDLAKALAGVLPDDPAAQKKDDGMEFEETNKTPSAPPASVPAVEPTADTAALLPPLPDPTPADDKKSDDHATAPAANPELEEIKLDALKELRPLMDHVDLLPEEKFDAYLMLIRITDDPTLIAPAHTAAQNIADEKRKAEALLDIIKEIDYLSKKDK